MGIDIEHVPKVATRKNTVQDEEQGNNYYKPLQIANNKHDVVALKVTDPREITFENVGLIELEDAETGEVILVDSSSKTFRKDYAKKSDDEINNLKRGFRLINIDFINIRTDQSYIVPLINFFKMREKRH